MAENREFIKNKKLSMTRLILLVFTIALVFVPPISTLETRSNESSCSDSSTCANCTINDRCVWSLEKQMCANKTQYNSSSLIVSGIAKCPRISLNIQYKYLKNKYRERVFVQCILEVSNDLVGFMKYLINSNINLSIGRLIKMDNVPTKNNVIIFEKYENLNWSPKQQSVTYYVSINFNDVTLQFGNEADHYLTVYKTNCADDERNKHCATCAWINDGHSNYFKWCSSKNTCDGRNQLYLKNDTATNTGELCPVNDVAHMNNDCAQINVTEVHPLSGPRAGGTTMTIHVTNHWILGDNGTTVTVTVAGTECENLRTSGPETITCTTSPPINATGVVQMSGPVRVQYSSPGGTVMIESSHTFQFVVAPICGTPRPVLDAHQRLSGVLSGGTAVPVRGEHFAEPCVASSARLYVVLAHGVRLHGRCDPPVNDTYMVCRSPRTNGTAGWDARPSLEGWLLSFGLDFEFAGNRSLRVNGPSLGYYVHPDPVVTDLEIDGNGSAIINGDRLQYVRPDDIAIRSRGSAYVGCVDGSTAVGRVVCVPAASVSWSREIAVKIGTHLVYTVTNRASPHSDDDQLAASPVNWYLAIVAPSVSVAFACVLVWYLRTKNWYGCLSKTASDAPVNYRWTARPRHKYRTVT